MSGIDDVLARYNQVAKVAKVSMGLSRPSSPMDLPARGIRRRAGLQPTAPAAVAPPDPSLSAAPPRSAHDMEQLFQRVQELEQSNKDVFAAGISCCDRAGSNGVAEDQVYAATDDVGRLRFPCYAHIASTAQGREKGEV